MEQYVKCIKHFLNTNKDKDVIHKTLSDCSMKLVDELFLEHMGEINSGDSIAVKIEILTEVFVTERIDF